MFFRKKKPADPLHQFEAAIRKAISIAELSGVNHGEMGAVLSSWAVSWERQALAARELHHRRTDGLHKSGNL
jgi:hypothetical protein